METDTQTHTANEQKSENAPDEFGHQPEFYTTLISKIEAFEREFEISDTPTESDT
jgi:hypothetical protein